MHKKGVLDWKGGEKLEHANLCLSFLHEDSFPFPVWRLLEKHHFSPQRWLFWHGLWGVWKSSKVQVIEMLCGICVHAKCEALFCLLAFRTCFANCLLKACRSPSQKKENSSSVWN
mmetsp:Transcript_23862/g.50924  ORF Transcript_23862/g.50924 Transcript_23862/m.50924 type:complete len:115 (+) Transcript_23862:100-444(+)